MSTSPTNDVATTPARGIAVVTGASSGIGEATARWLAAEGFHVVCAARRTERVTALADEIGGTPVTLDVTDQAAVDTAAELVARLPGDVTLLVNNAGAAFGVQRVDTADVDSWRDMLELNVIGTLRVTQAFLPMLRKAAAAQIVVVSSTAALAAYEGGGGYVAAKHGTGVIARTLRLELCGEPIRVCEIAPGMVATPEFTVKRLGGDETEAAKVYQDVDHPLTSDDIARCITWVATAPPHLNVDLMVLRPVAQASNYKVHRGPLFTR